MERLTVHNQFRANFQLYQNYYLWGLEQVLQKNLRFWPPEYACLRFLSGRIESKLLRAGWLKESLSEHVGCYTYQVDRKVVKFAIDAHDSKEIRNPKALDWADIYFKANYWTSVTYPEKVKPIVNGNGFLHPKKIEHLRSLRGREKTMDLVFISRLWGGMEHNLRLFESLAELNCKKRLLAIFPEKNDSTETVDAKRRLDRINVEWTHELVPELDLWDILSQSRFCFFRAGKYMCIPWRMLDLLCMGACIVFDAAPFPRWPNPLIEETHYLNVGMKRAADTQASLPQEYSRIPSRFETLFERCDSSLAVIRKEAVDYFERDATPSKVSDWLIRQIHQELELKK